MRDKIGDCEGPNSSVDSDKNPCQIKNFMNVFSDLPDSGLVLVDKSVPVVLGFFTTVRSLGPLSKGQLSLTSLFVTKRYVFQYG